MIMKRAMIYWLNVLFNTEQLYPGSLIKGYFFVPGQSYDFLRVNKVAQI